MVNDPLYAAALSAARICPPILRVPASRKRPAAEDVGQCLSVDKLGSGEWAGFPFSILKYRHDIRVG